VLRPQHAQKPISFDPVGSILKVVVITGR
jgi:hypothetical protein